jgi:pimeloyl-ACP methyl ester carboxylesterase
VLWLWLGLGVVLGAVLSITAFLVWLYFHLMGLHLAFLVRCFLQQPLFIIPRGEPVPGAEDVTLRTEDGVALRGCYLHTPQRHRLGVVLFGLEYGSSRWACVPYCQALLDNGFDIFAFEPRGQGESDSQPDYEPTQWVTSRELRDFRAALAYLKGRPDADPLGVGFFGISKGASAGVLVGAEDPYVRCFVTDGMFATYSTLTPYIQKGIAIVSTRYWLQRRLPAWYYGLFSRAATREVHRLRGWCFPDLEPALPKLAPRPLLMIHGEADTYIKPSMAKALFARARQPKELWLVKDAKHNQAQAVAGEDYQARVLGFFLRHLSPENDESRMTNDERSPNAKARMTKESRRAKARSVSSFVIRH